MTNVVAAMSAVQVPRLLSKVTSTIRFLGLLIVVLAVVELEKIEPGLGHEPGPWIMPRDLSDDEHLSFIAPSGRAEVKRVLNSTKKWARLGEECAGGWPRADQPHAFSTLRR